MTKIVLIIPEDKNSLEPLVYPPLGALYIGATLIQAGHDVSVIDLRKVGKLSDIPKADIYGFTATIAQSQSVKEASIYVRNKYHTYTIIGGAYPSSLPEDAEPYFDCVVTGEGEGVIERIVNERTRGVVHGNTSLVPIDEIPFPQRNLLTKEDIVSNKLWEGWGYGTGVDATTIISSRGCPWKCAFCANMTKTTRFRSVENFVAEIQQIIDQYNCRHFRFLDDNFLTNKERTRSLCGALQDLKIAFRCGTRSDCITEETCKLLIAAGCKEVAFGVESADNTVLELLKKEETIEDHARAIKMAKEYGLTTKALFMAGLPGETWETIEKNKAFLREIQPDKALVTLFMPYPGGSVWKNPEQYGVNILNKDFTKYFQTQRATSVIETNLASNAELQSHFEDFLQFVTSLQRFKNERRPNGLSSTVE